MKLIIKIIKAIFFLLLSFTYVFVMFNRKCSMNFIIICSIIFSIAAIYVSFTHKHLKIDYYSYYSKLRFVNPYIKSIFFVLVLLYCVFMENIYVSIFVILTMSILTIFIGGIEIKNYIYAMLLPLCFIMISTITIAVNFTTTPISPNYINFFDFYINFGDRYRCIELLFRSMGAVSCLYALSMSTPIADIIQVLYGIKCPKLIVELMFLIYRFIFMLMEVLHNMTISATSRGGYDKYKNSYYTYSNIGKNLFLYALKKTNNSFDAMTSRGYVGDLNFYNENSKIKYKEVVVCIIYILVLKGVSVCLK